MDNYFELKLFANISGAAEIRLNVDNSPFSKEIASLNLDTRIINNAYSISFSSDCYMLAQHFEIPMAKEYNFRESQAHIVIAVKRGYRINDSYQVLNALRQKLETIISEHKEKTYNIVYARTEDFVSTVRNALNEDALQLRTNITGNSTKAVVPYSSESVLINLIAYPNRPDYSGYSTLYFIKENEAQNAANALRCNCLHIDNPVYIPTYTVLFPDGHKIYGISKDEDIDYVCSKKYHNPISFKGSVADNISEWNISFDGDSPTLKINLELRPMEKRIKVRFYDHLSNPIPFPADLSFNVGKYTRASDELLLRGAEIDSSIVPSSLQWKVLGQEITKSGSLEVLSIRLKKLYAYDLKPLYDHLKKAHQVEPQIALCDASGKQLATYTKDVIILETPQDKVYAKVLKPTGYSEKVPYIRSEARFELPKIRRKQCKIVLLNPEIKSGKVEATGNYRANKQSHEIYFLKGEATINNIEGISSIDVSVKAKGFKKYAGTHYIKDGKDIEVRLEPSRTNNLVFFFLICVVMVALGAGVTWLVMPSNENAAPKQDNTEEIEGYKKQIDSLNNVNDSLTKRIGNLETTLEALKDVVVKPGGSNRTRSPQEPTNNQSQQLTDLENKLGGWTFTQTDIYTYKNIPGHNVNIANAAQLALDLINADGNTKSTELNDYDIELLNDNGFSTFYKCVITTTGTDSTGKNYHVQWRRDKKSDYKCINDAIKGYRKKS